MLIHVCGLFCIFQHFLPRPRVCVSAVSLVMATTSVTNQISSWQPSNVVVFHGVADSVFCMGYSVSVSVMDEKSILDSVVEDQYSLGITGISLLCPGIPIPKFAPDMQGHQNSPHHGESNGGG